MEETKKKTPGDWAAFVLIALVLFILIIVLLGVAFRAYEWAVNF